MRCTSTGNLLLILAQVNFSERKGRDVRTLANDLQRLPQSTFSSGPLDAAPASPPSAAPRPPPPEEERLVALRMEPPAAAAAAAAPLCGLVSVAERRSGVQVA